MSFEQLLLRPTDSVITLDAFLNAHGFVRLNFEAMRRQIRQRSPDCYPGMMEVALLSSSPPPGRPAA